jgi:UV DNA damage endonuclease
MKLGYPVISHVLTNKGVTPYREPSGSIDEITDTHLQNLYDLRSTLEWNEENGIKFYRMSNHLIYPIAKIKRSDEALEILTDIGNFAREKGHRLSFHCSHYAVLCSPKDFVRKKAREEIEKQSMLFDQLGYEPSHWNKINIHVGGSYGDKEATINKWIEEWEKLSDNAKARLVIENDDKASLYSVKYLHENLHSRIGIPITFDYFHHDFCHDGLTKEEAAILASSTWKDSPPCFHFASSRSLNENNGTSTAHADWIYEEIESWVEDPWIMVESKARDLAVLNYLKNGPGKSDMLESYSLK